MRSDNIDRIASSLHTRSDNIDRIAQSLHMRSDNIDRIAPSLHMRSDTNTTQSAERRSFQFPEQRKRVPLGGAVPNTDLTRRSRTKYPVDPLDIRSARPGVNSRWVVENLYYSGYGKSYTVGASSGHGPAGVLPA
ncbi:hypothetical protein DPMN_019437 [Dreissena polymorpha]|uniref:Uncharacterized protein n=1 Tax=Dreissena polymorpha TaxID=45954 RepID=A0A9D4S878_DREPO|nr:hypothetical protein DPMN_019437 [Dreissena polymorpha]